MESAIAGAVPPEISLSQRYMLETYQSCELYSNERSVHAEGSCYRYSTSQTGCIGLAGNRQPLLTLARALSEPNQQDFGVAERQMIPNNICSDDSDALIVTFGIRREYFSIRSHNPRGACAICLNGLETILCLTAYHVRTNRISAAIDTM